MLCQSVRGAWSAIEPSQLNWIANFIWGIADDILRDLYVRGKYRDVILPMVVLRRLDAVLEPTKPAVLAMIIQAALYSDADPAYWLERAEAAGVPAGDFLLPALSSSQAKVRELAARLLGPSAIPELDRLLRSAPEPEMRANAAMTLGGLARGDGWRFLQHAP